MSKKTKQKLSAVIKNNMIMLGKIAKYTPMHFVFAIIDGIFWGALSASMTVFSFKILNAVDAGNDFAYAVSLIFGMAVFYLIAHGFENWYWQYQHSLFYRKLRLRMHRELFLKARTLDVACFDDPEFYNDFVWAMNESDKRANEILDDTSKIVKCIVASTTILSMLWSIDKVVMVILLLFAVFSVVINLTSNKISFEQDKESNPLYRKNSYINRVYHLADFAKEIRISRADELLMKEYEDNTQKIIETERKYGKKYFVLRGLLEMPVEMLVMFGVPLYTMSLLGEGLAVGSFAATVMSMWNVRSQISDLVTRFSKYPKHSLYIEKYLEFMNFKPQIAGEIKDIPEFETLEFKHVDFSYEFSNLPKYRFHDNDAKAAAKADCRDALKDINLKISKGEKIAIVGYNGAGKTTLIKLIMRFYDPDAGEILYNGINIRHFEPEAYRKHIGTVFQDFKLYAASIAENVMNGEFNEQDTQTVIDALHAADFGAKLASLEEGIHTHLTREFNEKGTNLSGGEAQKIAIARVFARNYPIVIMDEPSAALDPMAEYNLNQSILHNTEDKTVIFISHRLSTTRIADKIYMFDSGHLIEEGSHDELLSMNGKYAEMFRVQSEKYQ